MKELSNGELKQKQYYNEIALEYDRHYGSVDAIFYRKALFEEILKNISLKDAYVLDAMCGGGQNTAALHGHGCKFFGFDLSEKQCVNYYKRFPHTEIRCASIFDCGLPNSAFDIVICDSLHHLHPKVNDGIGEMVRVLKSGGHLLIWEPSAGSLFDYARQLWYRMDKKYFEKNEAAIDVNRIIHKYGEKLRLRQIRYGGNLAYLFVFASMALRIPSRLVPYYAPFLMHFERLFGNFQTKFTSLWVLALFEKH